MDRLLCNNTEKRVAVHLVLGGQHATSRFHQLMQHKHEIETEIGAPLEWHCPPDKKQRHIILRKHGVDPSLRDEWAGQFDWLRVTLELFHKVFQPRVRALQTDSDEDVDANDIEKE